MRKILMVLTGAIAGAPCLAQVPAPVQPVPRATYLGIMDGEFGKMDANKDKVVAREEIEQFQRAAALTQAQARNQTMFAQLDSDRNGQLSRAEFARLPIAAPQADAAPLLTAHDLNKDGSISLIEYRTVKLASFDRIDTDKDGIASAAEMKAVGIAK